jgi:hypothetical protein
VQQLLRRVPPLLAALALLLLAAAAAAAAPGKPSPKDRAPFNTIAAATMLRSCSPAAPISTARKGATAAVELVSFAGRVIRWSPAPPSSLA